MGLGASDADPARGDGSIRERFRGIIQLPDARIDLAEAALLIAAEDDPSTDISGSLAEIDRLGARVRQRLQDDRVSRLGVAADEVAIGALHHVLFTEEAYHGATASEYPTAGASYLHLTLARRRGLPITLAVLYIAVARRAGLDAVGIGLPGHFIVEFRGAQMRVFVDPFNGGMRRDLMECETLVRETTGRAITLLPHHMQAQTAGRILVRMLENIKGAHLRSGNIPRALEAVERILVVAPSPEHVRDRGLLLREIPMRDSVNLTAAWFDLQLYARLMSGAPDGPDIARMAAEIWRTLGRMN